jgi:hypothetical protein
MYSLPENHRRLYMHPAHRTVGVCSFGAAIGERRSIDDFSPDDTEGRAAEDDGRKAETEEDEDLA